MYNAPKTTSRCGFKKMVEMKKKVRKKILQSEYLCSNLYIIQNCIYLKKKNYNNFKIKWRRTIQLHQTPNPIYKNPNILKEY